jgi:hypothetical protein
MIEGVQQDERNHQISTGQAAFNELSSKQIVPCLTI